jgi:hypothetical protein
VDLWDSALDTFPLVPRDGTRLRQEGDLNLYEIRNGLKRALMIAPLIPKQDPSALMLWSGALSQIPTGETVIDPPPARPEKLSKTPTGKTANKRPQEQPKIPRA